MLAKDKDKLGLFLFFFGFFFFLSRTGSAWRQQSLAVEQREENPLWEV